MWLRPCWAAWLTDEYQCEPGTRALISFVPESNIPYLLVVNNLMLFLVLLSCVSGCKEGWLLPKGR